jgi:class 3 adenylate cyclase
MKWFKTLSIKSKLIAMLLAVSSCSILVTAYLGYRSGQSNLTDRVFSQLTSVRASKAYQIESYFKSVRYQIQIFSEMPSVIEAMQELTTAYRQLESRSISTGDREQLMAYYRDKFLPQLAKTKSGSPVLESFLPETPTAEYLQYHYIAANPNPIGKKYLLEAAKDDSEYSQIHRRYHAIFLDIIQKFGYYDLFLIDDQGTVIYTVYKETDFTTNFTTGAYRDSNLARLVQEVRQAKEKDYAKIVDFEAYAPSYDAPAAFIAAPLYNGSQFIGVLAVQLSVNEINNVMTGNRNWSNDGLGKTGETYLVGPDYLMRSVSRFLVESPESYLQTLKAIGTNENTLDRIREYKTSILEQNVHTRATEAALFGQQGTQIVRDYRNIPVLSSYAPLQIDGLDWAILAEIDLAEAYEPIYSFGHQILIYAALLMVLVTLLAMGLAHVFVKPIERLIQSTCKIAGGELDTITAWDTEDEFGELAKSFNIMILSLRAQTNLVEEKNRENEQLLLSIFPAAVAKRLKRGDKNIAESVSNVAVFFSDLTGFSQLAESLTAYEIVTILNDLVTAFDEAAERYGMEKIKTIGDSYMAVCGLSVPYLDRDRRAVDFALEMLAVVRRFDLERGYNLNISVGINSGDVVAGIVGTNKFIYDVWGDTINLASALKSACPPGNIFVAQEVRDRLHDLYEFEAVEIPIENGQGLLNAWKWKKGGNS